MGAAKKDKDRENTTILPNLVCDNFDFKGKVEQNIWAGIIVKLQQYRTTLISRDKIKKFFSTYIGCKSHDHDETKEIELHPEQKHAEDQR